MAVLCFQAVFLVVHFYMFSFWFAGTSGAVSVRQQDQNNDIQQPLQVDKYQPNWASLESRPMPAWYDEAKIGIFIHWGVFSVPSFVGVGTKGLSEWFWYYLKDNQMNHHHPQAFETSREFMKEHYKPGFQYQDFVRDFTAEFYDPEHWADVFAASGAR
jgi:alpha-L-fucosidase